MLTALRAAPVAAFILLAACNNEPEVIEPNDPMKDELAKAPPVALPPAIQASKTYRCKDNSLVYVNFYTNNTAKVGDKPGVSADGTELTAAQPGGPYTAEGYSLSGSGDSVTYSAPGGGSQTCSA